MVKTAPFKLTERGRGFVSFLSRRAHGLPAHGLYHEGKVAGW